MAALTVWWNLGYYYKKQALSIQAAASVTLKEYSTVYTIYTVISAARYGNYVADN